ncbi:MAG: aminopeptidase P family protein [Candidatus Edwardsbacteria bacterium]|nr:aminopeptidase P family protein [Candidatus Edwardsbacteria bacterium]
MADYTKRVAAARKRISDQGLDALLVSHPVNIRYLCGYSGSAGLLLVAPKKNFFLTDFRYQEQIKREVKATQRVVIKKDLYSDLLELPGIRDNRRIGFESQHLTYDRYDFLRKNLKAVKPADGVVEQLRTVKQPDEIRKIAAAARIADQAFSMIIKEIKPGMTELAIAARLDYLLMTLGASGSSFDTIVGSGPNGALPHVKPGERRVRKGDFIVLDFGAFHQGYCSDMTRTVVLGKPTARHKEVYGVVLRAQAAGLAAVKADVSGKAADGAARRVIERAGYGRFFGHGLGHGVGMEVHEWPRLGRLSGDTLQAGNVVTVEPGIYLPGWGGVRIEDLVVVTKTGNRILTGSSKQLIFI